jgi:transcriptional regulator with XRE-family HTH domain
MENRIKELREQKGWSMRELAARVNATASTINKLEKGRTALNIHWMKRLGDAFNVQPEQLLGKGEFSDEATPYTPGPAEVAAFSLTDTQFLYEAKTEALSQIGVVPGDILVADASPEEMAKLSSEDVVIAQVYDGMKAVTILRQYIAPSLLITNSSSQNAASINLRTDDAAIKAVVVSSHSRLRKKAARSPTP